MSYDKYLAKELKDRSFAREFLLAQLEGKDGLSLLEALKETIRKMGVREYSEMANMAANNVSRMLNGHVSPSLPTIQRYLEPFGLRAKLILEKVA